MMQQTLDDNVYKLKTYMSANKLVMNDDKTKFMIVSKNKESFKNVSISASPKDVKDSSAIKLLGVEISADMKFNNFMSDSKHSIYKQLLSRVNAIKILRKSSDFNTVRQFSNGIFMSKLTYGAEIWAGAPAYLVNKLQHLQLETARTCIGPKSRYWSKTSLLKEMKWLDVRKTAEFAAARLIHQIIYTEKPALLAARYAINNESISPTRLTGPFSLGSRPKNVGKTRTTSQHFRSTSYKIYNNIPVILKEIKKKKIFKKRLKRYLMNNDDLPENRVSIPGSQQELK